MIKKIPEEVLKIVSDNFDVFEECNIHSVDNYDNCKYDETNLCPINFSTKNIIDVELDSYGCFTNTKGRLSFRRLEKQNVNFKELKTLINLMKL
jgi:hypothetical protein